MQDKQDPKAEAKRAVGLNAVMTVAMLFLAAILIRSAVVQLGSGRIVSGVISAVGGVIFFFVGVMMANDLRKRLQNRHNTQEDKNHGS